jgi:outer membrane protein
MPYLWDVKRLAATTNAFASGSRDGSHGSSTRPSPWMSANRYAPPFVFTGILMKPLYRLALAALACLPLSASAQPAPKVFVVDVGRVFEAHPQTQQQQAALKAEEKKVTDQLQRIDKEIRALADKLKDQQTRFDDPTLAATQRDAIRAEGQKTSQELQAKQAEGQQLMAKTQNEMQQRIQKLRGQIVGDIAKVATDVARKKGGTLVYDKGSMIYADPAYDITSDVLAEVAKSKGAPAASK